MNELIIITPSVVVMLLLALTALAAAIVTERLLTRYVALGVVALTLLISASLMLLVTV